MPEWSSNRFVPNCCSSCGILLTPAGCQLCPLRQMWLGILQLVSLGVKTALYGSHRGRFQLLRQPIETILDETNEKKHGGCARSRRVGISVRAHQETKFGEHVNCGALIVDDDKQQLWLDPVVPKLRNRQPYSTIRFQNCACIFPTSLHLHVYSRHSRPTASSRQRPLDTLPPPSWADEQRRAGWPRRAPKHYSLNGDQVLPYLFLPPLTKEQRAPAQATSPSPTSTGSSKTYAAYKRNTDAIQPGRTRIGYRASS